MEILKSKQIYCEEGIIDGFIVMDYGKIIDITKDINKLPIGTIKNYDKFKIIPGIIDLHSHGYRTFAARTVFKEELYGLAKVFPSIGVTATLPTVCGWNQFLLKQLETVADVSKSCYEGSRFLGIHIEGSFFHPEKHNATPLAELKEPSIELCEAFLQASDGFWNYMTLAPELPHAYEVLAWLREHNIIAGGGHSIANYEEFLEAKKSGMKVSIHTGNAMKQMDRRDVGLMGGSLLDPDIYCEINCDFVHLSEEMLKIMFRMKGNYDKFIMISDSDTVSGVQPGYYLVAGQRTRITSDQKMLLDDGTIAGSCHSILYGIRNLVETMQISLQEVLKMSSYNAAKLLGIEKQKGSIKLGKDADLVVLSDNYEVIETYVEGNSVFKQGDTLPINPRFKVDVPIIEEV